MQSIDPITTEVIRNAVIALTEEMKLTLVKTAYNPLIYEVMDFSVALTNEHGELYGQAAGLTIFLASLPATIKNGIEIIGRDNLQEGDVILANDPFTTGTHISDTAVYVPIFFEGELVAFSINMAHWADMGGMIPGGWTPNSTDVFQEGMRFTHLKLYRAGQLNEDLNRFIEANVRFPQIVHGDLMAQIAACQTGARRYKALCQKYGPDTIRAAMHRVFDESERLVRARVQEIPDGVYSAETYMDHDGVELDKMRKLKVTITVSGSEMVVDLTGSSDVTSGPINLPLIGTRAAVEMAFKALTVPMDPANAGHTRPLQVIAPENSMLNPQFPAPTDSYGYVGNSLSDLVVRALAPAMPDKCIAGTDLSVVWHLPVANRPALWQALPLYRADRWWLGRPAQRRWRNAYLLPGRRHAQYPWRGHRSPLPDYGQSLHLQPGFSRGRAASRRPGGYSGLPGTDRLRCTKCPPTGLFGGSTAKPCHTVAWPDTAKEQVFYDRHAHVGPLLTGDTVSVRSGGGGGWGDPLQRDPRLVARDAKNELITVDTALKTYGVVLDPATFEVDAQATDQVRAKQR